MPPRNLSSGTQTRGVRNGVRQSGGKRGEPGPPVNPAHRVSVSGPRTPFVVVRKKLGLVGGHIDIHRAFGAAALARQAEVEGFANRLAPPTLLHGIALEHLEEQVGATTRRVHFFLGGHVARAHRAIELLAALTNADAPLGRVREAAVIVWKLEVGLALHRGDNEVPAEDSHRAGKGQPPCADSSCCRGPRSP